MSEWTKINIASLLLFGNGKSRPLQSGPIPVYGGNGIMSYAADYNYDQETIIIGRVGAYCGATYYENKPIWISDNALSAKAIDGNDPKYLYYLLKYLELNQFAEGSSHPLLTQTLLKSIETEATLIFNEQQAIASVLSSLDDKIDLLHRQNKTLESMAETLFRQWLEEDKIENKTDKEVSFFGKIVCGKTPSKSNPLFFGTDVPFLKIPDMHNKVFITNTTDNLSLTGANSQPKKTIPAGSITVSCIATVGLVCITDREMQTNQQINSIIPNKSYYTYFLYLLMKSMYEELHNLASGGTATLNLNTNDFSKIKISVPCDKQIKLFHLSVVNYFEKIKINMKQIQTLEKLRDTLLPKLMSGEVRVKYSN